MSVQRVKEYRRKGGKVFLSAYDWEAEPGDFYIDMQGRLFRLAESRGRNKASSGELSMVAVPPPHLGAKARIRNDGVIIWVWMD